MKILLHAVLEGLGGLSLSCALLLCRHNHFGGRLAALNAVVHSRAWRAAVTAAVYALTSAATVAALDGDALRAGAAVFAAAVGVHLALELIGGGSLSALRKVTARTAVLRGRWRLAAVLCVWYVLVAAVAVTLADGGHGAHSGGAHDAAAVQTPR